MSVLDSVVACLLAAPNLKDLVNYLDDREHYCLEIHFFGGKTVGFVK